MAKRKWSYEEITASAIVEIQRNMRLAAAAPSSQVAETFRSCAEGVFEGWSALTMGWQEAGDIEKLKALIDRRY